MEFWHEKFAHSTSWKKINQSSNQLSSSKLFLKRIPYIYPNSLTKHSRLIKIEKMMQKNNSIDVFLELKVENSIFSAHAFWPIYINFPNPKLHCHYTALFWGCKSQITNVTVMYNVLYICFDVFKKSSWNAFWGMGKQNIIWTKTFQDIISY